MKSSLFSRKSIFKSSIFHCYVFCWGVSSHGLSQPPPPNRASLQNILRLKVSEGLAVKQNQVHNIQKLIVLFQHLPGVDYVMGTKDQSWLNCQGKKRTCLPPPWPQLSGPTSNSSRRPTGIGYWWNVSKCGIWLGQKVRSQQQSDVCNMLWCWYNSDMLRTWGFCKIGIVWKKQLYWTWSCILFGWQQITM